MDKPSSNDNSSCVDSNRNVDADCDPDASPCEQENDWANGTAGDMLWKDRRNLKMTL